MYYKLWLAVITSTRIPVSRQHNLLVCWQEMAVYQSLITHVHLCTACSLWDYLLTDFLLSLCHQGLLRIRIIFQALKLSILHVCTVMCIVLRDLSAVLYIAVCSFCGLNLSA